MKTSKLLILLSMVAAGCSVDQQMKDYTQYVNPFIGTDFKGNTYPGAQAPFGMVQLSPDNGTPGWDWISGYFYPDSTIAGFSHTHLSGTGAGDLYDISFMPVTLPYKEDKMVLGIYSTFSHENESATAGYYQVKLDDYGINVELTATERCGIQKYTFPEASSAIFLDLKKAKNWDRTEDSSIEVVDSVTLRGYRFSDGWAPHQKVFFYTKLSRPFDSIVMDTVALKPSGKGMIARLNYTTRQGEEILVRTALSGVSLKGAELNFQAEAQSEDFEHYRQQAAAMWNKELAKIEAEGTDKDQITMFYTAMYHSMLAPTIYSDVDHSYFGPDNQIHQTDGGVNYSTFSLWDTYRASHPLFTLTQTERTNDMVKSFLAFYEQNGRLPVWNFWGKETDMMIGYHSVPVIVDAYLKGIGDFDAEKALEACVKTANIDDYRGIGVYKKLGYIPCYTEKGEPNNWSMSTALEYAFDDYCIGAMAEKMGKEALAKEFYERGQNYRKLYNPATGFMQPRDAEGNFLKDFNPDDYSAFICESNAWQYLCSVQQDIEGLIDIVGGKDRFEQKLDSMFTYSPTDIDLPLFSTGMIGQYAHGNEPGHHVAYLYNYTDSRWKTQKYVAQIMHELYQNNPSGLCGNEDCGQMSAWYVFSAMGFYPVNPVSGEYHLGTPLFDKLSLNLPEGKTFTVLAPGVSRENCYVKSVTLNGKPLDGTIIRHADILQGGTLQFEMTAKPQE